MDPADRQAPSPLSCRLGADGLWPARPGSWGAEQGLLVVDRFVQMCYHFSNLLAQTVSFSFLERYT